MRPKTRLQQQVAECMPLLRPLTPAQREWGYCHALYKYAHRAPKGTTTCMECGHQFHTHEGQKNCICPHCHKRLKVEQSKRRRKRREGYFCMITTCKGLQVLRYFLIHSYGKPGERPTNYYFEVMQRWIDEQGHTATTALVRQPFSFYVDAWCLGSELELRQGCRAFDYIDGCCTYPSYSTIPSLRRNGFRGRLHGFPPASLFEAILTDSTIETLFKAGQFALVGHFLKSGTAKAARYWPSIKIAIRRGYIIKEPTLWCDYIDFLTHFGKDTRNPMYVCPDDLRAAHDRWAEKKHKIDQARWERERREREIQDRERNIKTAAEREEKFRQLKSKFFGIHFTDGVIAVHVLESVEEYRQEAEHMHHCVFGGGYYLKPDTLILSATIGGKRVETIEVSLNTLKILQCYGACNQFTEYHDRILELVNRNTRLIAERLCA